MPIDKRAWPAAMMLLAVGLAASVLSSFASGAIVFLILAGHLAFFRDPKRETPSGESPVSPADGKIMEISDQMESRYLKEESIKIRIFLSILDVHINRAPIAGRVEYLDYVPGKFFNAMHENSNLTNESNWIGLKDLEHRVFVRQIAGAVARRIRCDIAMNEEVARGQKIGVICYGSGVEIYIPKRFFKPAVKVGDRLKAGQTLLGKWIA